MIDKTDDTVKAFDRQTQQLESEIQLDSDWSDGMQEGPVADERRKLREKRRREKAKQAHIDRMKDQPSLTKEQAVKKIKQFQKLTEERHLKR